jgi:DNA-binding LacI/PurR family transcriptional regulator
MQGPVSDPNKLVFAQMSSTRRNHAPTLEDVAQLAGVSRALVSLVMRDSPRVSTESRRRVQTAATSIGYRPNLMARNLAARRTMTIGVLLNDLHNPWFAEVADGVHDEAGRRGYQLILASGRRSPRLESTALDTFLASRVDAVIVAGCRLPEKRLAEVASEVPLVSVGRAIRHPSVGSVTTDDARGAHMAIDHLVSLGHRRIAHIDGGNGAGASPRRTGYRKAMNLYGLIEHVRVVDGDFTEPAGAHGAELLLRSKQPPSAIFTANDLSAVGALDAIERTGLHVPDDISLIGFDNTALAALNHIGLTTIDQPRLEMGVAAAAMAIDLLVGPDDVSRRVMMEPCLVVRSTTRAPVRA